MCIAVSPAAGNPAAGCCLHDTVRQPAQAGIVPSSSGNVPIGGGRFGSSATITRLCIVLSAPAIASSACVCEV